MDLTDAKLRLGNLADKVADGNEALPDEGMRCVFSKVVKIVLQMKK